MTFMAVSSVAFPLILLFGSLVGHSALCVYSHNWWYGQPLPRRVTDVIQVIHGLLVPAVPVWFLWAGGYGLLFDSSWSSLSWKAWLAIGYCLLCCFVGWVVFPAITVGRLLRPQPGALIEDHAVVIDVAKELGRLPIGEGKLEWLARLKGNEVFLADFRERTLQLPRLPDAWDGLKILHLTDLHFCGIPDRSYFQFVMDHCSAWSPDLIALTGDYVDSFEHHRWILPTLGRLKWSEAAFVILGNHDQWYEPDRIRRRFTRLGMHVLGNSWKYVTLRGQRLAVVGHEGPWFKPAPGVSDCPPEVFRLCLSHTPDNLPWARQQGIDLMLAGHVHGGQVRFPVFGSLAIPSLFGRRYDCGVFQEGPTVLHVNRGLGAEQPLRYNCKPEATFITLRRAGS